VGILYLEVHVHQQLFQGIRVKTEGLNYFAIPQPWDGQHSKVRGPSTELGVNGTSVLQTLHKAGHISQLKEMHAGFTIRRTRVDRDIYKNHMLEVYEQLSLEYLDVINGQMFRVIMML
jgi:hypothetical protein